MQNESGFKRWVQVPNPESQIAFYCSDEKLPTKLKPIRQI